MAKEIEAIYEDGVFRPVEPVHLEPHQRVTVMIPDPATGLANGAAEEPTAAEMPKNGAELIAYWEQAGVIRSRPEITDSVAHARNLRRQAKTRQP